MTWYQWNRPFSAIKFFLFNFTRDSIATRWRPGRDFLHRRPVCPRNSWYNRGNRQGVQNIPPIIPHSACLPIEWPGAICAPGLFRFMGPILSAGKRGPLQQVHHGPFSSCHKLTFLYRGLPPGVPVMVTGVLFPPVLPAALPGGLLLCLPALLLLPVKLFGISIFH